MVPFVLVGLAVAAAVGYHFLAFFTPRPEVALSSALSLGGSAALEWRFRGRVEMLKRLRIALVGKEWVSHSGQKGSSIDSHVFRRVELLDLAAPPDQGFLSVTVPAGTMHSFAGENNKIVWSIKVEGEIPIWPDLDQDFVIEVLPAGGVR